MERNKIQKEKRESLNYSFKDLKAITKIPIFRLKDFENGLAFPHKKEKAKLIEALKISPSEYDEESDLGYPFLFQKEQKQSAFQKVLSTKIAFILSLVFTFIFGISFAFSVRECVPYAYNVQQFYQENILEFRSNSINKSAKVNSNYVFSDEIGESKIEIIFNENVNHISESKINYIFNKEQYNFTYSFYADTFDQLLKVNAVNEKTNKTFTYYYYLNYLEQDLVYNFEIANDDDLLESSDLINVVESEFPNVEENLNNYLKNNFSLSLDDYLSALKNGQYSCYSHESEFYYKSFFLFLGFILSLLLVLVHLRLKRKSRKNDEDTVINSKKAKKEYKALKKDISLEPFIKENGLIIFSQIFYFLASFSLYLVFANLFEVNNIHKFPYIDIIIDVLRNCLPIANILILFLNLNRKIINNRPLKTALSYLFIGIIFTSLECLLIFDLSRSGDFFINLIISLFPKNLFFAMGLYALIYYFLFHKSVNLETHKFKNLCFRLISVPLLLFLVFSVIYPQLTNAGIVETNLYLNSFVASIDFSYSFIALGFILVKKSVDSYFISIYGDDNFAKYQRGNRYQFIMNIVFIALLLITFIITLSYNNDENMLDILGLKNFIYIPCLIPLIFFFKKRLDERNVIIDTVSAIAFLTSNVISYLLIYLTITS